MGRGSLLLAFLITAASAAASEAVPPSPAPQMVGAGSLVANVAFPAASNTQIVWTATFTGGAQPLEYQFWRFRQGTGWSMAQDYGASQVFVWTPTAGEAGKYALQVWVRNVGSTAPYDAWAGTDFFDIVNPGVVVNVSANAQSPIFARTPVTFTAIASGSAALEYAFFLQDLRYQGTTLGQFWSTRNTFTWVPTPVATATTYRIEVWVRAVGATTDYDARAAAGEFTVYPVPPAVLTSLSRTPAQSVTAGTPMTWSATASGGMNPLVYKFLLFSFGQWTVLQDYSVASSVTWTPPSPGTYAIEVWVHSITRFDEGWEDWRDSGLFTVAASPTVFVSDVSVNVTLPATVTRPMTWTASAGGGSAPLSYKFWRFSQSSGWAMVQDYSTNPSYTWTPSLGDEGTYALQVWVRAAGSIALYDSWRGTNFFQVLPSTVLSMTSVTGDWVGGGAIRLLTRSDGPFTGTRDPGNPSVVRIQINQQPNPQSWDLYFAPPSGAQLTPGIYSYSTQWPFEVPTAAGLDVSGEGRSCFGSFSRFVVREITYASDGTLTAFAADFEQHCGVTASGLYGSVRFNSTIPVVPVRRLTTTTLGNEVYWSAENANGHEYNGWHYAAALGSWTPWTGRYVKYPNVIFFPNGVTTGEHAGVIWERPIGTTIDYDTWWISEGVRVIHP